MRQNNRTAILDAAVRLVQRSGITAITYEAVAAEAGFTRGGLLYHFPSREDLLRATHAHMAARWDTTMARLAGAPADALTPAQRHATYARASVHGATRAELLLLLEAGSDPDHAAAWQAVMQRWAMPPPDDADDEDAMDRFIARLASDGLWLFDCLLDKPLSRSMRERIAERLARASAGDGMSVADDDDGGQAP
ncbi:TetR/AcrR family transcriptional regulator [Luteimonas abyssi]|uniref:TetR/AcrR family transcriptional regulator n=1 Tax=Luteimonas abyssi TaxID=1247514 RepID=UPI000737B152|nr:TetR family transcriptional regulator [Luteimonas abyssi]